MGIFPTRAADFEAGKPNTCELKPYPYSCLVAYGRTCSGSYPCVLGVASLHFIQSRSLRYARPNLMSNSLAVLTPMPAGMGERLLSRSANASSLRNLQNKHPPKHKRSRECYGLGRCPAELLISSNLVPPTSALEVGPAIL